jgi:hypothetical protein
MGYPPSKLIVYLFCYLGFDDGMHIESSLGERLCLPRQQLTDHKTHAYLFVSFIKENDKSERLF